MSQTFLDIGVPTPVLLNLQKFDPALGTLLTAEVVFRAHHDFAICVDNTSLSSCASLSVSSTLLGVSDVIPPIAGMSQFQLNYPVLHTPAPVFLGTSDGIDFECFGTEVGLPGGDSCVPGADHFTVSGSEIYESSPQVLSFPEAAAFYQLGAGPEFVSFEVQGLGFVSIAGAPQSNSSFLLTARLEMEVTYSYCPTAPWTSYCDCVGAGPCANDGGPGEGCANSTGSGAVLDAFGSASLVAEDLSLSASQLPPNKPGVFFHGTSSQQLAFGDGLLCAGGAILRLEVTFTDGNGDVDSTVNLAQLSGAVPGDMRYYQFWYRDPSAGPCGTGFNLSNALEVIWAP